MIQSTSTVSAPAKISDWWSLSTPGSTSSALVDLMGLNTSAGTAASNPEHSDLQTLTHNTGFSLLDDELMPLGKQEIFSWPVKAGPDL